MKTIKRWLKECLSEEEYHKAEKYENKKWEKSTDYFGEALYEAFIWHLTEEGEDYWGEISIDNRFPLNIDPSEGGGGNLKKIQEEKEYWNVTAMDLLNSNKRLVYQIEKLEVDKEELLKTIDLYKECFKLYIDPKMWDKANEFLSIGRNLLAEHLSRVQRGGGEKS